MLGNWAGSQRSCCLLLRWGGQAVTGKQPVWRGVQQLIVLRNLSPVCLSQLPCPLAHSSWESPLYISYLLPLNLAVSAEGCPIAPVAIWNSLLTIGNGHPASKSPGGKQISSLSCWHWCNSWCSTVSASCSAYSLEQDRNPGVTCPS